MANSTRPLSPHIGIYKWQITMTLSILHRATGIALSAGTILVCLALVALAAGADSYAIVKAFCASWGGLILLIGWSWSLMFHLCNGLRHLAWDAGYGFSISTTSRSGWTVVVLSALLTLAIWVWVFAIAGAGVFSGAGA